jgi:hypothetical protein
VYLYPQADGKIICCGCTRFGHTITLASKAVALAHLAGHRADGDRVPFGAVKKLWMELGNEAREKRTV